MSIANNHFQSSLSDLYGNIWLTALFTLFLVISTITDVRTLKIPNKLNATFAIARLLIIPFVGFSVGNIVGAAIAFLGIFIPAMIKNQPMGGDIKCATVIGLYTGMFVAPVLLLLACLYLAVYTAILFQLRKTTGFLPFAPFFLLSSLTLMVYYYFF